MRPSPTQTHPLRPQFLAKDAQPEAPPPAPAEEEEDWVGRAVGVVFCSCRLTLGIAGGHDEVSLRRNAPLSLLRLRLQEGSVHLCARAIKSISFHACHSRAHSEQMCEGRVGSETPRVAQTVDGI
eukprot:Opistho-1_new@37372